MSYLGYVYPLPIDVTMKALSYWDKQKVKSLVKDFPGIFEQAQEDWAKFKLGVNHGLFDSSSKEKALSWFRDFPKMWETIRPNFMKTEQGEEFGNRVDDFIYSMNQTPFYREKSLGFVTAVIAGVLIVGGVAAGLWAVGYIQKQRNVSNMIDNVTAGKLSPEILKKAIDAEKSGSMFAGFGSLVKWLLIGGIGITVLPAIWKSK